MLLFAGHDPGSLNHIRPIAELAQSQGREVQLVELRPKEGIWAGVQEADRILDSILASQGDSLAPHIEACITGISTNKAELDLFQACNARDIFTAAVIDFQPGHRLQTSSASSAYPSLFLMTNEQAVAEVKAKHCVAADAVLLGGSTYLEQLALDTTAATVPQCELLAAYGLPTDAQLVPFFLAPDDMVPDAGNAIPACVRALDAMLPAHFSIAVRPHPRNDPSTVSALRTMCEEGELENKSRRLVMDAMPIDNKSMAMACQYTLSMGSTVSIECMAWGTPSAFFQCGWDPTLIEAIMHALPAPRVNSQETLDAFLDGPMSAAWKAHFKGGGVSAESKFDVENCLGATARCWEHIQARLESK